MRVNRLAAALLLGLLALTALVALQVVGVILVVAMLIIPGATAYLLTGNYRVILDYNCSNFYALSVGLLADAVER